MKFKIFLNQICSRPRHFQFLVAGSDRNRKCPCLVCASKKLESRELNFYKFNCPKKKIFTKRANEMEMECDKLIFQFLLQLFLLRN